ncbi:hypothetical protein EAH72_03255 [Pseudomonas caspiana]|nr:hypothetical protein EAH72_03255 [Pseudomonas caspiana]
MRPPVGASLLAMAVYQSKNHCPTLRHREQARSHRVSASIRWRRSRAPTAFAPTRSLPATTD